MEGSGGNHILDHTSRLMFKEEKKQQHQNIRHLKRKSEKPREEGVVSGSWRGGGGGSAVMDYVEVRLMSSTEMETWLKGD